MSCLVNSTALKFRWINGQCFEFKLNNGVTLLTDPWFHMEEGDGMLKEMCPPGFTLDDIEGADYVFLNHTHGDHTANLEEVVEKFHSTVITHSGNVLELMKVNNIPVTDMYPVDYEGTYYFDGFILETHHATHHRQPGNLEKGLARHAGDPKALANAMGGTFNMNFVLTTAQGMRIAFIGGNDDGMIERLQGTNKPNIIIRNKMASSKVKEGVAENFAAWFMAADTQILVPMHYETWLTKDPEFAAKMITDMNRIMEENGKVGRVAPMVRGKWYTLDLAINEA
ncbi:MAG: MBL fold metallo-hydrolase [Solobacterium sp.]|nr:MBL fold metallo-hydrolase [Solobacterium sp.]